MVTNSRAKFQIVIAVLQNDIMKNVADLVKNPPVEPYEALKARLISTYAETENQPLKGLQEDKIRAEGERPSHFLIELKRGSLTRGPPGQASGSSVSTELLHKNWLQALPEKIQATMSVTGEANPDKIAKITDRIANTIFTHITST